jgi:hypothetical protein
MPGESSFMRAKLPTDDLTAIDTKLVANQILGVLASDAMAVEAVATPEIESLVAAPAREA